MRAGRGERACVAGLLLAAAALRAWFAGNLNPPSLHVASDMAGFVIRAQRLLDADFHASDTLFAPGEHLLLALSGWLLGGYDTLLVLLHVAAGVFTCWAAYRLARRVLGRPEAFVVLVAAAFHLPFVGLTGFYLAETMMTAAVALVALLLAWTPFPWAPSRAAWIGVAIGVTHVFKGTNNLFIPILVAWSAGFVWHARRRGQTVAGVGRGWAALSAGFGAVLLLQGAYFLTLYGRFLPVPAGGGYNFALGKCPGARIMDSQGAEFLSPRAYYTKESGTQAYAMPFQEQGYFWRAGIDCIRRDPLVLARSLGDVGYLFAGNALWPLNAGRFERLGDGSAARFTLFVVPGVIAGVLALARRPFSRVAAPFLLGLSVCASAYVFLGELRFRVPFDVVFLPLAVLGWRAVLVRLLGRGRRGAIAVGLGAAWVLLFAAPMIVEFVHAARR